MIKGSLTQIWLIEGLQNTEVIYKKYLQKAYIDT